jgi:uncharacterized membrane protein
MAVELVSFTVILLFRPYKEILHNLGVLLVGFNVLYALLSYLSLSEDSAVFLVFILEGLLIIAFFSPSQRKGSNRKEITSKAVREKEEETKSKESDKFGS